jgi:outer membrane receptor protein involved in Fe transport
LCAGDFNPVTAAPEPVLTQAQCANTGVTAAQYGNIPLSPAGQYNATFGGDPDLEPEESDSVTVGAVFTPSGALDGLTLSIDYWSIEVESAIQAGYGEEFVIQTCGETGDPTFCSLINRGPNGNLWIGTEPFIVSTNVNIGFYDVAGIDITGTYAMEIGQYGSLDFGFRGTVLEKFDQQPSPGSDVDECGGTWGGGCGRPRPEWKHTFNVMWATPWNTDVGFGWRRVGEVEEFLQDRFTASAQDYFDLSATYTADWLGGTTQLSAGATNVLDEDPPINGLFNNIAVFSNGNTVPGTWDGLGRYYFVGFSQSF